MAGMGERLYKAINAATGQVIATRVKIAEDFRSRSVGLLNRASLDEDEGLLIKPCNSIHTFFMKFPIDVVFLDKKWHVVRTIEKLKPWRLAWAVVRGFMVLEIAGGKLSKVSVKTNDFIY